MNNGLSYPVLPLHNSKGWGIFTHLKQGCTLQSLRILLDYSQHLRYGSQEGRFLTKKLLEPEKLDEFGIKSLECSHWLSSSHDFLKSVSPRLMCLKRALHQFQQARHQKFMSKPCLMSLSISLSVRNGALQSRGVAAESTQIAVHGGALKLLQKGTTKLTNQPKTSANLHIDTRWL